MLLLISATVSAETFTVADIRLQGLQRVSAGTVFNILPINVGEQVDEVAVTSTTCAAGAEDITQVEVGLEFAIMEKDSHRARRP